MSTSLVLGNEHSIKIEEILRGLLRTGLGP